MYATRALNWKIKGCKTRDNTLSAGCCVYIVLPRQQAHKSSFLHSCLNIIKAGKKLHFFANCIYPLWVAFYILYSLPSSASLPASFNSQSSGFSDKRTPLSLSSVWNYTLFYCTHQTLQKTTFMAPKHRYIVSIWKKTVSPAEPIQTLGQSWWQDNVGIMQVHLFSLKAIVSESVVFELFLFFFRRTFLVYGLLV